MGKYIDEYLANMVKNRLERESNIIKLDKTTNNEEFNNKVPDFQEIIKILTFEKQRSHKNGLIPNIEQFCGTVKLNNMDKLRNVKIERLIDLTITLSRNNWNS